MLGWTRSAGIKIEFIQPGHPQQNAYIERFNRTVRYEWLGQYHWRTLGEIQDRATQWMWIHNGTPAIHRPYDHEAKTSNNTTTLVAPAAASALARALKAS